MKSDLMNKIINLYSKSPRIAILMSGKGSNAQVILENVHRYKDLNFVTICTDRKDSNALNLCERFGLKYFCLEGKFDTQNQRETYFKKMAEYLSELEIDTLIYAGFMKISTSGFVNQFPGINVHPADLTITDVLGKPKYIGMHAIRDAIDAGEKYLASTAHIVDSEVDCGQAIMVSKHLILEGQDITDIDSLHENLKTNSEHLLYPSVIELLSKGRILANEVPYRWDILMRHITINNEKYFSKKLFELRDSTTPLDLAFQAQDYSSQAGFDFTDIKQVFGKVKEEFTELSDAFEKRHENFEHFVEEIGDCFFTLVNLCRFVELHPDAVVKQNVMKYLKRCSYMEEQLKKEDKAWSQMTTEEIMASWKKAKITEKL
jgi:phosphoribosylglycinamide formyltransferase-1